MSDFKGKIHPNLFRPEAMPSAKTPLEGLTALRQTAD